MGAEIRKELALQQGVYSFNHIKLGQVTMEVGKRSIELHAQREVHDSLGNPSFVSTMNQGSVGVTLFDALASLPRNARNLVRNFEAELQAAKEGQEITVFDSRAGVNVSDRVHMRETGRVPRHLRTLKSETF